MKKMNYAACGLSNAETQMGDAYFAAAKAAGIPIVAPEAEGRDGAVPYIVKEIAGVKVGIAAFNGMPTSEDSAEKRKKRLGAYKAAREQSDVLIVLDQGREIDEQWVNGLGKRFGPPDIVIGGLETSLFQEPKMYGNTMLPPTSQKAAHVGVVKITLQPGQPPKMEFSRTLLDEKVAEDEEVLKLVTALMEKTRVTPQTSRPASGGNQTASDGKTAAQPTASLFHYAILCKSCHETEYETWKKSKHARALATLVSQGRTQPECLVCHSEYYKRTKVLATSGNRAQGVECMSCHAEVLPHDASYKAAGKAVAGVSVCLSCHDKSNSPNFDQKTYWDKVDHKS